MKVDSPAWSLPVVQFKYDGLGRRIYENYYTTPANGTPKHDYLYYSAAWQVIQETDASNGVIRQQNVWSPVYVDAMIERDRDTDHNGTFDERLYVQQDANWNVTAIVSTSGVVLERYAYDAYGVPTFMTGSWGSASSSAYDWRYLHQGGRYDAYTGLYGFRHRDYNPVLGRWIEQDPIGLAAGDVNLYRYERNRPDSRVDPMGLMDDWVWPLSQDAVWSWDSFNRGTVAAWRSTPFGEGTYDGLAMFNQNITLGLVPIYNEQGNAARQRARGYCQGAYAWSDYSSRVARDAIGLALGARSLQVASSLSAGALGTTATLAQLQQQLTNKTADLNWYVQMSEFYDRSTEMGRFISGRIATLREEIAEIEATIGRLGPR